MEIRSTFDLGLYLLGAATILGSVGVVGIAIILFERRRKTDLRALREALSRILMEFGSGSRPVG